MMHPYFYRLLLPFSAATLAVLVCIRTSTARAQDDSAVVKPTPEHTAFKAKVGVWDAKVQIMADPAAAPMESKGVETVKLGPGGLWLLTDFEGDGLGAPGPFQGHGITGYDPDKKQYQNVWIDSYSQALYVANGTASADGKTWTLTREAPDMTGKLVKYREVTESKDDDHRTFTMYAPGPDGKEAQFLKIEYTRRKQGPPAAR